MFSKSFNPLRRAIESKLAKVEMPNEVIMLNDMKDLLGGGFGETFNKVRCYQSLISFMDGERKN